MDFGQARSVEAFDRKTDKQTRVYVSNIVRNTEGRFLALHCVRKDEHQWRFPAGKLEANECLLAAAARELREETGLEPLNLAFHSRHTNYMDGGLWTGYYFLCTAYYGRPAVQERDKHDQIGWLSYNELFERDAARTELNITRSMELLDFQPAPLQIAPDLIDETNRDPYYGVGGLAAWRALDKK